MSPNPGVSELAATAARLYRANVRIFAGTALMVTVLQALEVANAPPVLIIPIFIALWPVITGVLAKAVEAAFMGRPAQSVQQVYESIGWRRFLLLGVANIVLTAAILCGLVLLVVPGIYLWVRYQFVPQAIVLERAGIPRAMSRSAELVRGSWWRVFGTLAAVYVGAAFVNVVVFLIGAAAATLLGLPPSTAGIILVVVITLLWALMDPLFFGTLYLLYFDLSRRQPVPVAPGGTGTVSG